MTQHKYIDKKKAHGNLPDFESLKKEGIGLLHDLCGETWTDFNAHDPGVTILDQICFGLTDLVYRTEFDLVDYLTGKDGRIDLNEQALYLPQDIFPCQPVTFGDYRKIIIDSVPHVENVWFKTCRSDNDLPRGLCRVFIDVKESENKEIRDRAIEEVTKIYSSNRNLSEDLGEVEIIKHRHYSLHGDIEISKKKAPANILAEIYYRCSKCIDPGVSFYPYEEMLDKGMGIEDIFSGPLTKQGFIDEGELDRDFNTVTIAGLIGAIGALEGISHINDLWFEDEQGRRVENIEYDSSLSSLPRFHFPANGDEVGIRLLKNNKLIAVSLEEVNVEFGRLDFERKAKKHRGRGSTKLYPAPEGNYRNLGEYSSIQNLFPAIYGINRYGLPDSESLERKAQASQLKAYLLFFEQVMANFLANLDGIPKLFSLDDKLKQTYFHQYLNNDSVPGVEEIYAEGKEVTDPQIAQILNRYDDFGDRRNRVLDYLLGIYGERFSQNSLRHFSCYYEEEQSEDEIISNKIRLLRNVVELGAGRAQAFNYREAYFNNTNLSGLQKKLNILLALKCDSDRSLTAPFTGRGIELVSHDELDHLGKKVKHFNIRNPENLGFLSETVLRKGIQKHAYQIREKKKSGKFEDMLQPAVTFEVKIKLDEDKKWLYPISYTNENKALSASKKLRSFLVSLNVDSEGLHIVEHILLRPLNRESHHVTLPDDFYSFRISVVFPSWTARSSDKGFRKLAEETVTLNCPAHIFPEFYWLEFRKMVEFEDIYEKWLLEKRNHPAGTSELDAASERVAAFLIKNRKIVSRREGSADHG